MPMIAVLITYTNFIKLFERNAISKHNKIVTKKTSFCPFKNSYLNFILFYFISIETPKTCNMQDLLGNLVRLFLSCFWLMQSIRLDIDPKLICSYLFYLPQEYLVASPSLANYFTWVAQK